MEKCKWVKTISCGNKNLKNLIIFSLIIIIKFHFLSVAEKTGYFYENMKTTQMFQNNTKVPVFYSNDSTS